MPALELTVYGTIAAGVMAWALAEIRASRAWWTAGALLTLVHSALAFLVFYEGSHAVAQAATMRQTEAMTGVTFAGGIYVNYVFLGVWVGDALWWWVSPRTRTTRPRWMDVAVRGFLFFMMVNGAVIFADGWARVIGVAAVAGAGVGAWHRDDSSDSQGAWHRTDSSDMQGAWHRDDSSDTRRPQVDEPHNTAADTATQRRRISTLR